MDYILDNIGDITELIKSGFIAIVGLAFIGIAIWIKTKEDRWNFRNIGIALLAGGIALFLTGIALVIDELQYRGMIVLDSSNPVWMILDIIKVLAWTLILVIAGCLLRAKRIKENDMCDMVISGRIAGYDTLTHRTIMYGYAQPTVEYIDPYSGEPESYVVNQNISRKKHPVGSEYRLLYSREERRAYEKKSNKAYKEMEVCCFGMAVIVLIVGIVKIVTGFFT